MINVIHILWKFFFNG